jgi:uncharacterized protein YdhG (YjbR/CyaY superfamily)
VTAPTDIDAYLAAVMDPAQRTALTSLRAKIRGLLPDTVECISYAMPGFRQGRSRGKIVIGFASFARHCGLYPHSGGIIPQLADELASWKTSKSGVQFTPDHPVPDTLVARIIALRLAEIADA